MAKRKNLYHSDFAAMGAVTVAIKSAVLKSKFPKDSMPNKYIDLMIGGQEYAHTLENESCVAFWTQFRAGTTVTVEATGSREEAAFVLVSGTAPQQPAQPHQPVQPAQPRNQQTTRPPAAVDPVIAMKKFVARNLSLGTIALQAVETKRIEFENVFGRPMPELLQNSLFTSLLYGASAQGITDVAPLELHLKPVVVAGGGQP